MSLSASRLQAAIYANLQADITPTPSNAAVLANLNQIAQAVAAAVVAEITTNAAVSVSATTAEVASVIAPTGGGPCTGTLAATGTVS